MATQTKAELFNIAMDSMQDVFAAHKVSKKAQDDILAVIKDLLEPKKGGGTSLNPPMEIDGVMNYYCRFHQRYEPESDMVMSNGKSKGYCRAGISAWNKNQAKAKKEELLALEAVSNGDFEAAKEHSDKSKEIKDSLEYDYDADWAAFKA